MANTILKSKSLKRDKYSDEQIKDKCGVTRFMSFESAIQLMTAAYQLKDKPVGYNITNDGIEVRYD